jgi:phospholipid/cholesterol/gamma-HCH transport system permease protein
VSTAAAPSLKSVALAPLRGVASSAFRALSHLGGMSLLAWGASRAIVSGQMALRDFVSQLVTIGVHSVPLVSVIAALSGIVSAQQGGYQMSTAIPLYILGSAVTSGIVLELAPLMTAIALIGRVGARITAELGTMRVSEQIDALYALGRDPVAVLAAPRIAAGILATPLLVMWAAAVGVLSGMVAAGITAGVSRETFLYGARLTWHDYDLFYGAMKGVAFGFLIPVISSHMGLTSSHGAEGVGRSTTSAVVTMIIAVFFSDALFPPLLLD